MRRWQKGKSQQVSVLRADLPGTVFSPRKLFKPFVMISFTLCTVVPLLDHCWGPNRHSLCRTVSKTQYSCNTGRGIIRGPASYGAFL